MRRLAERVERADDPLARQIVAEAHVDQLVARHLVGRVSKGIAAGAMPPAAGAIMKLLGAVTGVRRADMLLELAGPEVVDWAADDADGSSMAETFLMRQGFCLGGGSNEIQRNIISERVLGMPREWAGDREIPYRDVQRNTMPTAPGS